MKTFNLVLTFVLFTSCSMMQKIAVRSTADIFELAEKDLYTEFHYDYLTSALPGNLLAMQGLLAGDPENKILLRQLIKGHAGLAFSLYETNYIKDQILDIENSSHQFNAILSYQKSFYFAEKYFALFDEDIKAWSQYFNRPEELKKILNDKFDDSDLPAIFYAAQAWGGLINLQRNRTGLTLSLPVIKVMIDHVCAKDPNFEWGNCQQFQAILIGSRPKALGGNPKKGQNLMLKLIKKYPENLLLKANYIQYFLITYQKENEFKQYMRKLDSQINQFKKFQKQIKVNTKFEQHPYFNFFNSIAAKRYQIINKYKRELF